MAVLIEDPATGNQVWRRLRAPGETIGFSDLTERWQCLNVSARIEKYGVLAASEHLLPALRGAFGRGLMAGASQASLEEKICDWSPPCANDVFFGPKPALRVSRHLHEIPKPFVLSAVAAGPDLVLTIGLFGFAGEWATEVRAALVAAVRERLDWRQLAGDLFLPGALRFEVGQRRCRLRGRASDAPRQAILRFVTPVDCKNTDPLDRPESVLSRLTSRVFLLARWHEVEIAADWRALSSAWRGLECVAEGEPARDIERKSRRSGARFLVPGRMLDLTVRGDLRPVWPLLRIGEQSHVGRGAGAGLGRYRLEFGSA